MHNLDKILEHLGRCKPYAQQSPRVVRWATFIGWALFLMSVAVALGVKLDVLRHPLSGLSRVVAEIILLGGVLGSLVILTIAFIFQVIADVRMTFRKRIEVKSKTIAQRRLEVDESNVQFLLGQSDKSLVYAQCYLKQMNCRTGEWIAHVFGSAAPVLPLLAVLFTFSRDLGVIRWLEGILTQDHSSNPLVLRMIVFAIALAISTVVAAYGLAAEQRKNSYMLGLLEIAITLKSMMDKPRRAQRRSSDR
ncbi:hypothetical protein [Burkholderia anthina]|uniref:hypothetical protein n=1 Tax=Burkholderia anthina TaxID=179879 RepID=UPI00158E7468|nr:hypothetical protein [Burkholderia anthina]